MLGKDKCSGKVNAHSLRTLLKIISRDNEHLVLCLRFLPSRINSHHPLNPLFLAS